jgi:hypothetical protein
MEAVCGALSCNLEADFVTAWVEVDEGTAFGRYVSKDDIATFVKNGMITDELGASDSGNSIGDHCEVVVPKLSRELENINEVGRTD